MFINALVGFFAAIVSLFGGGHAAPEPVVPMEQVQTQQETPQSSSVTPMRDTSSAGATTATATTNATVSGATNTGAHTESDNLPVGSAWLSSVPLGDGKYTTSGAKQGYIYVCHVATGGQGARVNGPWIVGTSWNPSVKVAVQGSVSWPDAAYSMNVSGTTRVIASNSLPVAKTTGIFPIAQSDPAYQYDGNRGSISAKAQSYSLPAYPSAASSPGCIYGSVGIMQDGVILLDGFDALYRDALAHEEQDANEGHPNNDVGYHYHGFETGYVMSPVSSIVGFAFDGYPITGSKLPSGKYLHTADLDACHGITSTITLDGKQVSTYHYVLTQDFPYSISCFHGKSYEPKPGQGQQSSQAQQGGQQSQGPQGTQQGQGGMTPPQGAIDACSGKTESASCSFSTPNGTMNGICRTPPGQSTLACVPA